jgi:hypothetical protein
MIDYKKQVAIEDEQPTNFHQDRRGQPHGGGLGRNLHVQQ